MEHNERRRIKNRVREARAKMQRAEARITRAQAKMVEAQDEWSAAIAELMDLDPEDRIEIMQAGSQQHAVVS